MTALPPHISKIGLCTGQSWLIGCIVASLYKQTNLIILTSSIYVTTMLHWYNIKSSGIAKTTDMIVCISSVLFMSFHETRKFVGNGHEIWNSIILLGAIFYVLNSVIVHFQTNKIFIYDTCEKNWKGTYNMLSLSYIPEEAENRDKLYFYTTIIHTFFLHILTNAVAIYYTIKTYTI